MTPCTEAIVNVLLGAVGIWGIVKAVYYWVDVSGDDPR